MSITTHTRPSRLREPKGRPPSGLPPREARTKSTRRPGPPSPDEIVAFRKPSPVEFAERFRVAIGLALDEGAPDAGVARSRAALMTWRSASGLEPRTAEEIRCRVSREECARLGVEPLTCAPFTPGEAGAEPVLEQGDRRVRLPRALAVDGERPRRSGRR